MEYGQMHCLDATTGKCGTIAIVGRFGTVQMQVVAVVAVHVGTLFVVGLVGCAWLQTFDGIAFFFESNTLASAGSGTMQST